MAVLNIGVDLGVTAKHHAEIKNGEGIEVCSSLTFTGTKEGFDMVSKHALKNVDEGAKLRFICEPTSIAYSGAKSHPIPVESTHRFRLKVPPDSV